MKLVVQRVKETTLKVDNKIISQIPYGLVIFVGVGVGDTTEKADFLAKKVAFLRIFEDQSGKMNLNVTDVGGQVLSISQFTLYADVSHGNRPGFTNAEKPEQAVKLYDYFCDKLTEYGLVVKKGVFGADMQISQLNDGPVTILYEA